MALSAINFTEEDFVSLEGKTDEVLTVDQIVTRSSPAMVVLRFIGDDDETEITRERFDSEKDDFKRRLTNAELKESLDDDLWYLERTAKQWGQVFPTYVTGTNFPSYNEVYVGIGFTLVRPNGKKYSVKYFVPVSHFDQETQASVGKEYSDMILRSPELGENR